MTMALRAVWCDPTPIVQEPFVMTFFNPVPRIGLVCTGLRLSLCAGILFAATAATAQTEYDEQKKRLVAAIEAAGCVVDQSNQALILEVAGLTPDQGGAIVDQLMDDGEAEPAGDNLRLRAGSCR